MIVCSLFEINLGLKSAGNVFIVAERVPMKKTDPGLKRRIRRSEFF